MMEGLWRMSSSLRLGKIVFTRPMLMRLWLMLSVRRPVRVEGMMKSIWLWSAIRSCIEEPEMENGRDRS